MLPNFHYVTGIININFTFDTCMIKWEKLDQGGT